MAEAKSHQPKVSTEAYVQDRWGMGTGAREAVTFRSGARSYVRLLVAVLHVSAQSATQLHV